MIPPRAADPRKSRESGFSLLELIIVLGIFGLVLSMAYQILLTTLDAEQQVTRMTRNGKVGQAIMTMIRRDLQSIAYHGLGREVFFGTSEEIHFLTHAPVPNPPEDYSVEWLGELAGVGYVLKSDQESAVIFRRVKWDIIDEPLEDGEYYEVFTRAKSLEFRFFDGEEWLNEWDSLERIPEEPDPLDDPDTDPNDPNADPNNNDDDRTGARGDEEEEERVLALPLAIEVQLQIFAADERGISKDVKGEPIVEEYTMVVPLLAMERMILDPELAAEPNDDQDRGI